MRRRMKIIVAADKNWAIGSDGKLLCHIPGDLKYFKEKTMGKIVVMGRKTLESLPGGRPLPNRINIVLTKDKDFEKEGCVIAGSIEEVLRILSDMEGEAMVMGGGPIYRQLLPYCDGCYVTKIDAAFEADTYFPNLDADGDFRLIWESRPHEENGVTYRFTEYERI